MSNIINQPPTTAVDTQDAKGNLAPPSLGWRNWFSNATVILSALTLSGPTAERPTVGLFVGRVYFDVTLNKPVFYTVGGWRDATGALV